MYDGWKNETHNTFLGDKLNCLVTYYINCVLGNSSKHLNVETPIMWLLILKVLIKVEEQCKLELLINPVQNGSSVIWSKTSLWQNIHIEVINNLNRQSLLIHTQTCSTIIYYVLYVGYASLILSLFLLLSRPSKLGVT